MNPFEAMTITDIGSLSIVPRTKGEVFHMCDRPSFAVSFSISGGKLTYIHNGQKFISDPTHAILLPAEQTYELHCNTAGKFIVINFSCSDNSVANEFYTVPLTSSEPYISDYNELQSLAMLKKSDYRIQSLSVLYNIISRLAAEVRPANCNPLLIPAVEYIENNIDSVTLELDTLAEVSKISEVYLRKLFKNEFGISPKQYITRLRISRAKQLLKNSGTPISKVAEKCGFASLYHFSRAFKASVGYTPSEYRSKQSQLML